METNKNTNKNIVVHNTAVARNGKPQLYAVDRYHKEKFGMRSSLGWWVCYNEFVDEDGTRTKCRREDEETCANIGHNCDVPARCDAYSVCFAMNGDMQKFNVKQEQAWRDIVEEHPEWGISRHADIQENRTCPGQYITREYLIGLLDSPDNQGEKSEEIERLQSSLQTILLSIIYKLKLQIEAKLSARRPQ